MSINHEKFKFSVTCSTEDKAVLFCLRALCQFSEKSAHQQIGWGGSGTDKWKANNGEVTLRFTNPDYREEFLREAERLLSDLWTLKNISDNDRATPQRT